MLEFSYEVVTTTFMDPREDFARKEIETEIRFDPLTGESSRLAHFGLFNLQKEEFASWDTPENRSRCPFCPPNIEKITPLYPPEILPEGCLRRGETTLFPNISPYDQFSALAVISRDHVMPLEKLTARLLEDAFGAGVDFFHITAQKKVVLPYRIIIWNYMPPSGGGLVHPHLQVILSDFPGNLFRKTLEHSKSFYAKHQHSFWEELCRSEKRRGKRFIGELGQGCWLAAFAPHGVLGEFLCIFPAVHTISDVTETVIGDLAGGLLRLFRYFQTVNIYSFNMGLFFAPEDSEGYCPLHARIIPRTFLNLAQRPPDINALQVVMQEPYAVVRPEEQCAAIKLSW